MKEKDKKMWDFGFGTFTSDEDCITIDGDAYYKLYRPGLDFSIYEHREIKDGGIVRTRKAVSIQDIDLDI